MEKLVEVSQHELRFPVVLNQPQVETLSLRCLSSEVPVVFKLKTNNLERYRVRPNSGVIQPGATEEITIAMQKMPEYPPDLETKKDKLQLLAAPFPAEVASAFGADPAQFFDNPSPANGALIVGQKLRVNLYIPEGGLNESTEKTSVQVAPSEPVQPDAALLQSVASPKPLTSSQPSVSRAASSTAAKPGPTKIDMESLPTNEETLQKLNAEIQEQKKTIQVHQTRIEVMRKASIAPLREALGGIPFGANSLPHETLDGIPLVHSALLVVLSIVAIGLFLPQSSF
uniref:MSP domain-containing protein n=1 Tax=Timspurckia oligopyrenoides TaxID=708627 RepID=A0A7S1EUP4_9RHOD|mmetsp:Transcript_8953/g.16133  ORF Transcript_8953/g.16133 Transcript_8953/m.16133 type:complete len:285 (+) Transcript_8953:53-907(+)